ncbi:ATP-dependent DNA helicase RecG [Antricoccus suffuscus]|uniref:ATP-dependent DNA helicase RecG n=1 Tax=Antricoccus suffuscus TaxID=1629062 RepID=A0A2T1A4Y0_9ACTN|nr:OB-fold nucleic acid binding domain-containing protein [Antricoccus suffuscus]PRZ43661.1 ATP-dependent DNA helicase RecG [Antricoccus suffuscus]
MTTSADAAKADKPRGVFSRLMHRLAADADVLDAEDLQESTGKVGNCCCRDLVAGESVRIAGRLRSVVYTPSEKAPTLTAELFDGTGAVELVWLGQRRIPGIEPGREMVVSGRIADRDGSPALFNPWYELTPTGAG